MGRKSDQNGLVLELQELLSCGKWATYCTDNSGYKGKQANVERNKDTHMRTSACFTCNIIKITVEFHLRLLPDAFSREWHRSESSRILIDYLGDVFSVELRLVKARISVIWHCSDNKTTQKQLETMTS